MFNPADRYGNPYRDRLLCSGPGLGSRNVRADSARKGQANRNRASARPRCRCLGASATNCQGLVSRFAWLGSMSRMAHRDVRLTRACSARESMLWRATTSFWGVPSDMTPRRGGRVVECTALEMRHGCKPIGGSNPSLSAIVFQWQGLCSGQGCFLRNISALEAVRRHPRSV